ncbi:MULTISPECIES: ABC transporter substrate-binding protein [Streptomyces]|uniref:Peptide-binding protein n=1 Tax=Streptomyces lycii TaxID=2654337 RepID=A0ABQ7FNH4_9ACTN|nr:ABC transporter substrate-binding protein [Streptomyces lycii]KAF4410245.1 peptide-binding protein [Streptomyces lycii]
MRLFQLRIIGVCVVLLAVGVAGFRLLTEADRDGKPIVVGTTDTVSSLDPAGAYDAGSWAIFTNIYQSLLTYTPGTDEPVPDAAESCDFAGEALRTFVCELRPDVRFADGGDITAEDVKYSFDRIRRIADPQGPLPLLDTLESIRTEGDRITFRLRTADATFPFKIATGAGAIVDPDHYDAGTLREGGSVNGSGPYVLESWRDGEEARLAPNTNYRGAVSRLGKPVTIRYYDEPEQLAAAWKERSVDVAARQLPPSVLAAEADDPGPGVEVAESTGETIRSMVFNLRDGSPVADPAVRRAVAAVVDRTALARDVHQRTVDPLFSLIPKGIPAHTTPFFDRHPEPDPRAARALLENAGVGLPVRFTLAYSQGAATDAEAELLEQQLEDSGLFEIEVREYDWKKFQKGYAAGAFDAYCVGWVADFPDADTFTAPVIGADSAYHNGYHNPEVDKLIRATQRQEHRHRTMEDFAALQEIVAEDVPLLPLLQRRNFVLSQDVAGTPYLSDGHGMWRLWALSRS